MMLLVSFISYLDRNTLAVLAPTILKETRLTNEQYGFIISAFSIAYMLGNPVWGFVLDRIGLRRGMTASVFLWTIASTLHAFVNGMFGFAAARSVLGFGKAQLFLEACAQFQKRWLLRSARGELPFPIPADRWERYSLH